MVCQSRPQMRRFTPIATLSGPLAHAHARIWILMPNSAFSHIVLSLAAILLVPQALECCHGESHTVIESLAAQTGVDAGPEHELMHHQHSTGARASASLPPTTVKTVRALVAETVHARQMDGNAVGVSAPAGAAGNQSPSVAAVVSDQALSEHGNDWLQPVARDSVVAGRALPPPTPPPRA